MIVELPRGLEVDTRNVPDDFEEQIKKAFSEYTEGTRNEYCFQDKLCFLDLCIHLLHGDKDSDDAVMGFVKSRMEYNLNNGEFPQQEDYFCVEFMEECYQLGQESQKMYSHDFGGEYADRHEEEAVEKLLIRIMKAVLDWE